MENGRYKHEKYSDQNFPVYSSVQRGSGRLVQPHFHNDAEFMLVARGSVSVAIGTERLTVNAGEVLFIAPTAVHFADALTHDTEIRGLVFDPRILKPTFDWQNTVVTYAVLDPNGHGLKLISELRSALSLYGGEGDAYKCRMTAHILTLSATLIELDILQKTGSERFLRVRPALQYIETHFAERLNVKTLSGLVGLCDDRFIRVFKDETGHTPTAYITEFRLNEAMKLLAEGKHSVTEVADLTGFFDAGYFSKVFKNHIGITPKKYKIGR